MRTRHIAIIGLLLIVGVGTFVFLRPRSESRLKPSEPVSFARDIKPILADRCFTCHGPDGDARQAGLRLDEPSRVKEHAVEIARRLTSTNSDEIMPPPESGTPLTPSQIAALRSWLDAGAQWEGHWAFLPPSTSAPPREGHPIDAFIDARLATEGLQRSPEADRATMIRRVTLDLTGLPPTPEEVDAFLADTSAAAYEKVVDRLLKSPRYGERMAWRWLEAARYADTNGYQNDHERQMWRWRDWVIRAYNRNLPYDRFLLEQLAGDLLPDATIDQQIATGFNRNHRANSEFGADAKEYAIEYVIDRVETTATVFMGLTLGCARCHDHKYDPFTQREFYQLFAFFNNVPEKGQARNDGNSPPFIATPTPEYARRLREAEVRARQTEHQWRTLEPELPVLQQAWEAKLPRPQPWLSVWPGRALHHAITFEESPPPVHIPQGGVFHSGGRIGGGAYLKDNGYIDIGYYGDFSHADRFSLALWFYPEHRAAGVLMSKGQDVAGEPGYFVELVDGKLRVTLERLLGADGLQIESNRTFDPKRWTHLTVTYDGSRRADGLRVFIDGQPEPMRVLLDECYYSFQSSDPFRLGAGGGRTRFGGYLDEPRLYHDVLTTDEIIALATPDRIDAILMIPASQRSPNQATKLRWYFLEEHAPARFREAQRQRFAAQRYLRRMTEQTPTTMVMAERDPPRETHMLIRGRFDQPGEPVAPAVPHALGALPKDAPTNRLGLAQWLTNSAHPLTARVAVNRAWQLHFGTGLVKTTEDFGVQGEPPSHPELLDWLATEFLRSGWDVKRLHRLIVTSATYRQSSRVTPDLLAKDPENRLLARGPRFRLSAEMVRDQGLAASGLLVERIGGPSVKPYQPAGLWSELTGQMDYPTDSGDKLYRRSLYTYWKRTSPAPGMMTFDAAPRESCTVREPRTNTPLQALAMLNEVTYIEASRRLAERVALESKDADDRLLRMFRYVLTRPPSEREWSILRAARAAQYEAFTTDPEAAARWIRNGASVPNPAIDPIELATDAALANLILNLDEAITRE